LIALYPVGAQWPATLEVTVTAVSFHRTPEFMSVDYSCQNNNSNSADSENRIVKHNFSVRRRFQAELGIRLAFSTTVKEAWFWGTKRSYNNDK
jgi:hypothetical protein